MANVASRTNGNPSSCRRLANEGNWNCPSKFGLHVFSWGSLADGYIKTQPIWGNVPSGSFWLMFCEENAICHDTTVSLWTLLQAAVQLDDRLR